ncbi:hypothetical protein HPB51_016802 [Rhipicephalus microplus]|uniref:Uncharacterized protein n=1 Tax=Rhipicephalus microplus TaxID=6941 RepID=A0A9J6DI73_RHIMP|nr:hypothetical protein HPB51_016802 [Rhipicephalus microplus]
MFLQVILILKPACSLWSQSEESEESDCNDSQYSSLSSLGLSPRKGQKGSCRRLPPSPWDAPLVRPLRLSDKLLMVKPLEGSETLKQWQRLATPGLGDLFEDQGSGVRLKGGLPVQPPLEAPHDSLVMCIIKDAALADAHSNSPLLLSSLLTSLSLSSNSA